MVAGGFYSATRSSTGLVVSDATDSSCCYPYRFPTYTEAKEKQEKQEKQKRKKKNNPVPPSLKPKMRDL